MTDRLLDHADHDLFLIAELAAGEASPVQEELATAQIAACNDCATLADDLRALSRATAELPRPARPRDFTLTPQVASRIRRRGWRRLLAAFGTPRFELVRPLAAGLTTLGLAGFLLAAVPGMTGSPAAAPVTSDYSTNGEQRDQAYPSAQPLQGAEGDSGAPAPAAGHPGGSGSLAAGDPEPEDAPAPETSDSARLSARPASPLVVLSGSFLIVGLGLFALRWSARRLGDG